MLNDAVNWQVIWYRRCVRKRHTWIYACAEGRRVVTVCIGDDARKPLSNVTVEKRHRCQGQPSAVRKTCWSEFVRNSALRVCVQHSDDISKDLKGLHGENKTHADVVIVAIALNRLSGDYSTSSTARTYVVKMKGRVVETLIKSIVRKTRLISGRFDVCCWSDAELRQTKVFFYLCFFLILIPASLIYVTYSR
jgi:hypothetical protein